MPLPEHAGGIQKDPFKEPMSYLEIANTFSRFSYSFRSISTNFNYWTPEDLESVSVEYRKKMYSEVVQLAHSLGDLEYALREWSELPVKEIGETFDR